jgi:hypothetical protein
LAAPRGYGLYAAIRLPFGCSATIGHGGGGFTDAGVVFGANNVVGRSARERSARCKSAISAPDSTAKSACDVPNLSRIALMFIEQGGLVAACTMPSQREQFRIFFIQNCSSFEQL